MIQWAPEHTSKPAPDDMATFEEAMSVIAKLHHAMTPSTILNVCLCENCHTVFTSHNLNPTCPKCGTRT